MLLSARPVRRWRAANEAAPSSFASKIPTITEPVNDGVITLTTHSRMVPSWIKVWPILLGADNDVSSLRFIGWHQVLFDGKIKLWFPTVFAEFSCTACAAVGVAGAAVLDTERFCDTITPVAARTRDYKIAAGTSINSDYGSLSPTGDLIGHIILPITGFEKLELTGDGTTNTADVNALYSFLDSLE